ncbi:MAG TPA: hypothetical protein VFH80_03220 [Solirubrobacteraceae bacterium]|nr:hypothetical protein [Solirubrobacteraceae bacterium]
MDSARLSHTRAHLVRLRWRRAGAWLWPAFIAFTVADAVIGHQLPPAGSTESLTAAGLLGLVLNLLGVLLLSRPIAWGLRRIRGDLPGVVARDYGGTLVVLALTATLVLVGILHRPAMEASQRAMQDAIARAEAWIGDRAPDEFRRNLHVVSLLAIQGGTIYRACVPNVQNTKNYCVIVDRTKPLDQSVRFSGYEPNATLASGTD